MNDHSSRHADHRDQSIPDQGQNNGSGHSTSPTLDVGANFDVSTSSSRQPLNAGNSDDDDGSVGSGSSNQTKSSFGLSIGPTDIRLNPLRKVDDNNNDQSEGSSSAGHKNECTKQNTGGQYSDIGTVVDAALERPEARDRHVRFTDHVVESVSLIQRMLQRDGGLSFPDSHYPTVEEDRNSDSTLHHDDSDEHHYHHRRRGTSSGSVLGTLLRLESQLDRNHYHNHHMHHRRSTRETDSKEEKEEEEEEQEARAIPRRLSRSEGSSPFDFTQTHTHLRYSGKPELKRAFPSTASLPTQSKLSRITEQPRSWISTVTSSNHVVPSLEKRKREFLPASRRHSQNSAITTASQFEPITLEDRVRIAFEIANILQKHEFICKLTKALMHYGCPAHRLEYILKHVAETLSIDAEFVYIPNVMLVAFYDASTHTTETHFIRQTSAFDMHKLGEIYRLEKLVSHGEVTVDEALEFIDRVANDPQFYPQWLNPFIYALISFCGCIMFFGGRFKEAGISAALAMFFALYELFSGRFWGFQPIWEITVCIFIGFVARSVTKYHFCFIPIAFSSFIVILPGYAIAVAIIELVSRQLVSGVVRMVYAIIYSFLLGYGVEMGSELYVTIDRNATLSTLPECQTATNASTCVVAESQWFHFMTVPLFAFGYCQLLRARVPRWPVMLLVSVTGFVVNWLLSCLAHAPQQVIQVVPAFAVGLLGNLLTKFTGKMSFDAVLLAIFYLVPGSLGLKAAIGLFGGKDDEYGSQGASFALSMIETSIGITIGLFIATLIVYPKGAQHTPLMNF